jgi:hypothetical protein
MDCWKDAPPRYSGPTAYIAQLYPASDHNRVTILFNF